MSGSSMSGSNSSNVRGSSRRGSGRFYGVPKKCWCGEQMVNLMSDSDSNPYRRYFRCSYAAAHKVILSILVFTLWTLIVWNRWLILEIFKHLFNVDFISLSLFFVEIGSIWTMTKN